MEDDIIDHVTNTKDRSNKYNYLKSFKKLTDKRDLLEAKKIALITNTKSDARKINPDDYFDEFDELYKMQNLGLDTWDESKWQQLKTKAFKDLAFILDDLNW